MASVCAPVSAVWNEFRIVPDRDGTPASKGKLRIDTGPDAQGNITGHRLDNANVPQELFTGKCRTINSKHIIDFTIFMDNALYFFAGFITQVSASLFLLDGSYYVVYKAGPGPGLVGALVAEPGDTGGWGGTQGGA
jgi:hypothetical protein